MPREKNSVDVFVGHRLRERRTMAGLTQEQLAEAVNLTFQQIQKYEKGMNRMGASRLYQFAKFLDVPPSYFFEGLDEAFDVKGQRNVPGLAESPAQTPYEAEPIKRETLEFVRYYKSILDPELRAGLFALVKSVAAWAAEEEKTAPLSRGKQGPVRVKTRAKAPKKRRKSP